MRELDLYLANFINSHGKSLTLRSLSDHSHSHWFFWLKDFINCTSYTTVNNNNSPSSNSKKDEERKHKVYAHNPYNGVVYNDIIIATGVFSSKELWKMSKGRFFKFHLVLNNFSDVLASILQDTSDQNILQTSTSNSSSSSSLNNTSGNNIKIESSNSYYCNSYSSPLQAGPTIAAITSGYSE